MDERYARIYQAVRRIPSGRVATYGQIAALAGLPGRARLVGRALADLSGVSGVPWHRVVNAGQTISPRSDPAARELQKLLLRQEGVAVGRNGRISFQRYRWNDDKE